MSSTVSTTQSPVVAPAQPALTALDQLLHFLRHASALFTSPLLPSAVQATPPMLMRLHLPLPHHNEPIACVLHEGRHLITGTDLLRILHFRFRCLARPIGSIKKFEEGVFSDLRNLKVPDAARLENARSPLLDTLYRFGCVRTQKRQKVFYWDAVDHERLFRDAWEREARRERDAMASSGAADSASSLAMLDDATQETAAVWHRTRPLLLTYVRSTQDPVERPVNSQDLPVSEAIPQPVAANMAVAACKAAAVALAQADVDRELQASATAAMFDLMQQQQRKSRSRSNTGNSQASAGSVLSAAEEEQIEAQEREWFTRASYHSAAEAAAHAHARQQSITSALAGTALTDPFLLDLPMLAGSTHTLRVDPMMQQPLAQRLPLPAWLDLPAGHTATAPSTGLHPDSVTEQFALLAELEKFLTPPGEGGDQLPQPEVEEEPFPYLPAVSLPPLITVGLPVTAAQNLRSAVSSSPAPYSRTSTLAGALLSSMLAKNSAGCPPLDSAIGTACDSAWPSHMAVPTPPSVHGKRQRDADEPRSLWPTPDAKRLRTDYF